MPQTNVLPTTPPPSIRQSNRRGEHSGLAILLTILLTLVLIVLGERILFDLNRSFNPAYGQYGSTRYDDSYRVIQSPTSRTYDQGQYELYRLLLHGAFIVPVLLAAFLLYYWLHERQPQSAGKIVSWAFLGFAVWMTVRLIGESGTFLVEQYKQLGVYIVLLTLAVVLTWLIVFLQKRAKVRAEG